jgi:O-antigen/teichoic acid export membrane protein
VVESGNLIFVSNIIILSGIRQLAKQTIWYGLSNIVGRFINYLLTPILTYIYDAEKFGEISILFATAAFLNIIFTYGMETSYFRFNQIENEKKVFNTGMSSLLITTILFSFVLITFSQEMANFMQLSEHPEYVIWVVLIVAFDTMTVLPFSKLRHEGRPRKFALIKLATILVNVAAVLFFLFYCKPSFEKGDTAFPGSWYNPSIGIGYVFIAQLLASALTLLFLFPEWKGFTWYFDKKLFSELLIYSAPLLVVGFGGMINETIDRFMLIHRFDGTVQQAKVANGIYSANYKLAVLIVIFIQTFRMGAEPFFFKHASNENARETYARIMNLFIIACCCCFLSVVLFLDLWKHFMGVNNHPEYLQGLMLVPILMLAKIFLGIYYNLSIWYKLTNRNTIGAIITVIGAGLTIVINYMLVPFLGYFACAIATVVCYGSMMLISYFMGQLHYPIPYHWNKGMGYILLAVILGLIHLLVRNSITSIYLLNTVAAGLFAVFVAVIINREKEELSQIPVLNRFFKKP